MKRLYAILLCLGLSSPLIAQEAPGTITSLPSGMSSVNADVKGNLYGGAVRIGPDGTRTQFIGGQLQSSRVDASSFYATLGDGGFAAYGLVGSAGIFSTSTNSLFLSGVAVGPKGNVYVADGGNHRIRRVDLEGFISTVAGTGNNVGPSNLAIGGGFSGDGDPAKGAQLNKPADVALDAEGNLYIADFGNDRIRRIDPEGFIWTFAGTGGSITGPSGDGGAASRAILNAPVSVAVDVRGNVYIAEFWGHRVRRVGADGVVISLAGTGQQGFSGDGGPGAQARLSNPTGVAVDRAGNVYIADWGNNRVRRVDREGIITTFAGTGRSGRSGDGGPAAQADLDSPSDVTVDVRGVVYIAGTLIRRVSPLEPPPEIPSINLSPESLLLEASVGAVNTDTFVISNAGKAPLSVKRIEVKGTTEFRVSPTSATVAPGGSQKVTVTFAPASSGLKVAAISVVHDALESPSTLALNGRGIPALSPFRSPDFDGSGKVDLDDFFLFAAAFGQSATGDNAKFDLDGSGKIDFDDFFLFAGRFGG